MVTRFNYRKFLLCIGVCFTSMIGSSQKSVDSLQLEKWTKELSAQFKTNPDETISRVSNICDSLIASDAHPIAKSWMLYEAGKYSFRASNYPNTLKYARKGLTHTPDDIEQDRAGFYNLIGAVYVHEGNTDSAAFYMTSAARLLEKYDQKVRAGYVQNNIGTIYFDNGDYKTALGYMLEAERLVGRDSNFLTTIVGNVSYAYGQLDSFDQAEVYADRAIVLSEALDRPNGYAYGYLTKADIASNRDNDTELAIKYSQMAYDKSTQVKDTYRSSLAAGNLFYLYRDSNVSKALRFGEEAYAAFVEEQPRFAYLIADDLSETFGKLGNVDKAHEYLKVYSFYLDSVRKVEYTRDQLELINKYEAEKKQKIIANQKEKIAQESLKNSRLVMLAMLLGILSLISFAYFYYKKKIQDSQLEIVKKNHDMKIMQSVLAGEHKERKRLSKEIHDGLANDIAATKMYLAASPDTEEVKKTVLSQLDALHKEARNTSHNLLPKTFIDEGFVAYLNDYVAQQSQIIPINLDVSEYIANKSRSFEYWLLRIIQETVGNALKHSKANQIDLLLKDDGNKLTLCINDDGVGYDAKEQGHNLTYLRDRISELDGDIEVIASKGKGVKITIKVQYEL